MNIRFYNAKILTMEENRDIFEGEIHTQDEKILYVGPASGTIGQPDTLDAKGITFDREIDCKGNLLMPGFK
ncbi:MAG: amidohydrolase, partial [Lachnospiraceae bacterium]|nr:amidohydrolase [Lachnospiraceae bacterium]